MYEAVAVVLPGFPIQFWRVRKRPGAAPFLVQFACESDAERKLLKARNAVFKGGHVIADFPEIIGTSLYRGPSLRGEQLTQRRLSALDLAR